MPNDQSMSTADTGVEIRDAATTAKERQKRQEIFMVVLRTIQ